MPVHEPGELRLACAQLLQALDVAHAHERSHVATQSTQEIERRALLSMKRPAEGNTIVSSLARIDVRAPALSTAQRLALNRCPTLSGQLQCWPKSQAYRQHEQHIRPLKSRQVPFMSAEILG